MRRVTLILWICLGLLYASAPALAQEPPIHLRAVAPSQGQPGTELTLTIHGSGFGKAQGVQVAISGIKVGQAHIESDETIVARISIPSDAIPGPRAVEVLAYFGPGEEFSAAIEDGFTVTDTSSPSAPPILYKVSPSEVRPGSEAKLTLVGENFTPETQVSIGGGGVEIYEQTFVDPSHLTVHIGVLPEAALGPRPVVVETASGRAELQGGLTVAGTAPLPTSAPATGPMPTPSEEGNGWSLVLLSGGALLIWAVGFIIGRATRLRARLTWQQLAHWQWQLEASTRLPEPKKACTWACKADASTSLLRRWKVTALRLTPLPVTRGHTPPPRQITGQALEPLNEAARIERALENQAHIRRRIAPVADALLQQILAWRDAGQSPASIRLDVHLAKDVKCRFRLYHCRLRGQKLEWKEMKKWKGTLHQPGQFWGVLQGPRADEEDFVQRARAELESLLLQLVNEVRFKP